MSCIIELENINFSAQGKQIVKDISLQFDKGKTVALIGPSGCGKSTILKLSAGIIIPNSGDVFYNGKNIFRLSQKENLSFRKESGFVFQDSALWANQNLYQILELPLRLHFPGMSNKEIGQRIEEVVSDVGYKKDLKMRPSQLSMGEQKMLAFARAMMCRPKLLFLDEWTESLDESASKRLIDIVKRLKSEEVTIILVTHKASIIRDMADHAVIILNGEISHLLAKEQIMAGEDIKKYISGDLAA